MDLSFLKNPLGWLISTVQERGFGFVFKRYPGIYKGIVSDVEDPQARGRVKIMCPAIGQTTPDDVVSWAEPCMTGLSSGDSSLHGAYFPPEVGDQVWVSFEAGDPSYPVYMGGWLKTDPGGDEILSEDSSLKGIRTRSGHYLIFSDADDALTITLAKGDGEGSQSGAQLSILNDGGLLLSSDSGSTFWINDDKGTIQALLADGKATLKMGSDKMTLLTGGGAAFEMEGEDVRIIANKNISFVAGSKITLKAGSVDIGPNPIEPAVLGAKHAAWAASHSHIAPSGGGPTVPPATPPVAPGNQLSTTVKISP